MAWKVSRYTHLIPAPEGGVAYNGRTGAVAELSREGFALASRVLQQVREKGAPKRSGDSGQLFRQLSIGGFVVDSSVDEIALIERQYEKERRNSQFLLTILPTFACNLACDYCFVGKKHGIMETAVQDRILQFVRGRIERFAPPSMHVDWFGGEPLLAPAVIERLSAAFHELCDAHRLPYHAQVITNGTRITPETAGLLERARVNRVQITVDGMPSVHDQRRPYKAGHASSFAAILNGVEQLLGRFLIRMRINVDKRNLADAGELLDLFHQRGWLGPDTRFFPYLARISAFTDACAGSSPVVCSLDEFYQAQFRWMARLEDYGVPLLEQGLYQFPEPKLYNCGAVGDNGFVFTPEGEVHKCGLEVDDSSRALGTLQGPASPSRYSTYSPFQNSVCRECEFLPTCLGGCPRDRLDGRGPGIKDNCDYHKRFETQLLQFHLGLGRDRLTQPAARTQPELFPILR